MFIAVFCPKCEKNADREKIFKKYRKRKIFDPLKCAKCGLPVDRTHETIESHKMNHILKRDKGADAR